MNGTRRFSQASWGWDAQEPSKGTGKAEERTFCPASRPQVQSSIREDWASMSAEKALQTLEKGASPYVTPDQQGEHSPDRQQDDS